jgi:hypothetical protein
MKPKAVILSGYYNTIHKSQIEYFQNAKANGDKLFALVNSYFQRILKGSKEFQKENFCVFNMLRPSIFLSIYKDRAVCANTKHEPHSLIRSHYYI